MKTKFLFLLALSILISTCDVVERHTFRSYILEYYDYSEFVLEVGDSDDIFITDFGKKTWLGGWKSKGREKVIYDSLCTLHNDMSYKTRREYIAVPNWGDSFKGDILSIDVISNADFDEQHPALSPLNDIIQLQSISPYPYIISGYKATYNWGYDEPTRYGRLFRCGLEDNPCYHPIDKKLSEITPSDLILVGPAFLIFEKHPTLAQAHDLTVTIRLSDGRIFSPTITKVFE
jgi:hypothetical protein